jgi:hypothetical protein
MSGRLLALALGAILAAGWLGPSASAQTKKPIACSKIMDLCMKRAGNGHAGVCEDMYSQARNTGVWPATAEEDGTAHAPVPCTR